MASPTVESPPAAEKAVLNEPPPPEDLKKPAADPIPPAVKKEIIFVSSDLEKKALDDLKLLVHSALAAGDFSPALAPAPEENPTANEAPSSPSKPVVVNDDATKAVEAIAETVVPVADPSQAPPAPEAEVKKDQTTPTAATPPPLEEVSIWGVKLLSDHRSDTVLLKFLRARDFKPTEALAMLKASVAWRREFGIEALLDEDLGVPELERLSFMSGVDRDGHPVCYNVYGELQDKELYEVAFGDEERRRRFLRWRIQLLERGIRQLLDFGPGGISTMVQVTDLGGGSPGPLKRELRQAVEILQDNYPELVAKQVFIHVRWWYLAVNRMISPFLTQRTKSKFVFAGPSNSFEILFKYIAPEQIPIRLGGMSSIDDSDFTVADAVTEAALKPSTKEIIEMQATEACLLAWEIRVLGWDVSYGAEFVPSSEDGYTVIVQKAMKMAVSDEPVLKNSFKITEPGKVVITLDNASSKKKKLLYRYKTTSSLDSVFEAAVKKEIKN